MKSMKATASVFLTALKALSRKEREAVIAGIALDPDFREDMIDLALVIQRRREPSRPFREFLAEQQPRR